MHVMATGRTRYGDGDLLAVPAITRTGGRFPSSSPSSCSTTPSGAITGMAAVIRDVTARFEELRRLRRQLAEKAR